MILSTLNCEKEWDDFVEAHRSDPNFVKNCHRLNVGLVEKPPNLDEVAQMPFLVSVTQSYLGSIHEGGRYMDPRYKKADEHISVVARRLLASLFYFDENTSSGSHITGYLRCRLSPMMKKQFGKLLDSKPKFRIKEDAGRKVPLTPTFDRDTFSSDINSILTEGASWRIEVLFPSRSDHWEPISGF